MSGPPKGLLGLTGLEADSGQEAIKPQESKIGVKQGLAALRQELHCRTGKVQVRSCRNKTHPPHFLISFHYLSVVCVDLNDRESTRAR